MSTEKVPKFYLINKYQITIKSLKSKINDENITNEKLLEYYNKIVNLERQIMTELQVNCKELETIKQKKINKVDKLQRKLLKAEDELNQVNNKIKVTISKSQQF
jgi:hypothetical protein